MRAGQGRGRHLVVRHHGRRGAVGQQSEEQGGAGQDVSPLDTGLAVWAPKIQPGLVAPGPQSGPALGEAVRVLGKSLDLLVDLTGDWESDWGRSHLWGVEEREDT